MKHELTKEELTQAQSLINRIALGPEQGIQTYDDCKCAVFELHTLLTGEEHDFAKYFKKNKS